ncbi:peptide chain release factor H [Hamadaea tsunoensis]|uniref:peptide chain release factor H n=1 Tax=Hamadaea tsunoensis TaxID=53368 RepID=UPI0004817076|nr:peptide chain release factor H [Hamadaea tsunoensis]
MSVHLLMSAGRGPQECTWAVAGLAARLEAEAARRHLTVHREETVAGDRPGTFRSVLLRIGGTDAQPFADAWTGTLCWQAPSPYRSTGRKNWYVIAEQCSVRVETTRFDEADIEFVPCRTGGPGGQHRNKASTAVRATHRPTGTVVVVDTERQFSQNRRLAVDLIRRKLAQGDEAAGRAAVTARWQIHDDLVRGNPVRTEKP